MKTRRAFLKLTAAATAATTVSGLGAMRADSSTRNVTLSRIKAVVRREETILRLGGINDNFHISWAADDRQFTSACDGTGWFENPHRAYNSRLWSISGGPSDARFDDVRGYPDLTPPVAVNVPRYYGFGMLALDRRIYQFLSTWNHAVFDSGGMPLPDLRWVGVKLIYSPDSGRTWCNQDGSTPVRWEPWESRSRKSMTFFEEPQEAFSVLSILQMGRNYSANRDGYIYIYSPNGNRDGTMNELVMFRVPRASILDRGAFEYFCGASANGAATWARDINARALVHKFPRGWVNDSATHPGEAPWGWIPSVTYNVPLGLYMMASWGAGCTPDGGWFGKPSYFGLWVASNPWGPWSQVHEEAAWTPDHDAGARAYAPQIAPKWIAADGKSFWLVWSDYQDKPSKDVLQRFGEAWSRAKTQEDVGRLLPQLSRMKPYYQFNTQRVDLVVG
jgi:hypothetical protein